jgi:IPT/TIG domain/Putative Ig domain/Glycosyl hydrolase catalytic core
MNQPSETLRRKTASIVNRGLTTSLAPRNMARESSPRPTRGWTVAKRRSLLLDILWCMILPVALFLIGCTGFTGAPKSAKVANPGATPSPAAPSAATLQITTNALPVAALQNRYSATLAATGGMPPYSWSTASGQLPAGLTLSPATGVIAGTPTWAGAFSFTAEVQDSKANSNLTGFSINVSTAPAPSLSAVSPSSGPSEGGTLVTISGNNFRSGAMVQFGSLPAQSVQVVSSTEIQASTAAESSGSVDVVVQELDGQTAAISKAFTFTAPPNPSPGGALLTADVVVDVGQTVSETGADDIAAAKNIYASASAPESNGGLSVDWNLISSEFAMKRMRNINGLGDCAVDDSGHLTGCNRLNNDLANMRSRNLSPHVVVGQWAPSSIGGNPLEWAATQWAKYDALCYAVVNYVVNQYAGTGFNEALFEVGNELDSTTSAQDLWLTKTPGVSQGDPSRFTQFDTVYTHWAKAVTLVAAQNPKKRVWIAGPATGFWTAYYGSGQLWHNQIIQKYAAKGIRLDVVSLHVYAGEVNDLARYAQSIRNTLVASGNPQAEIWVTEWGPSDLGDDYFGSINSSHQGAAWSIQFLLQALKGTVTGGSFLEVRDNRGTDTRGVTAEMHSASWHHVLNSVEYPKPATNAFSMVDRMKGTRRSTTVGTAKSNLRALASSDANSASLILANYNYLFDYEHKNYSDLSKVENVTVAFKNLPFSGPVTVDRYLIDAQTSNLSYWTATGDIPPTVQSTQLQKVDSISAMATNGVLTLPETQLGQSAVTLWIVHP